MTAISPNAASWSLGHILDRGAAAHADSTALITGPQRHRVKYADLAQLVDDHCEALRRGGLRSGDVIAVSSANNIEFVVALLGAARAGIVVAPLDPSLPSSQRRDRVNRVGARVTVTDARRLESETDSEGPSWRLHVTPPKAAGGKPEMRLSTTGSARTVNSPVSGLTDRDALIMFTSGTTGRPKLVPWTHDNVAASVDGVSGTYQLDGSDATVVAMPMFHGHGLIATLLATLSTGGVLVLPAPGKFSAHTFWDDVAAADATWYTAVPTIHQILLNRAQVQAAAVHPGRLRFIRSCSAALPAAMVKRLEEWLDVPVLSAYGMTETTHQASSVSPSAAEPIRLNTVGIPTGLSVRIVGSDGASLPNGATGEIWLQGPAVVRGYLGDAMATSSTFIDGWVRSGDLGSVDQHGNLTIRGRIKELINRGGEKISPEHVEDVLTSHPGVAQAAVFGIPDELYGERVAALVVPRDGCPLNAEDLASFGRERLSTFEIPERIILADGLPLTAKGSVDRSKLAAEGAQRGVDACP